MAIAASALGSGCACGGFFATQCNTVVDRALKTLSCESVRTKSKDVYSLHTLSTYDADLYTVCCNFGSQACASYACPKGHPDSACSRQ